MEYGIRVIPFVTFCYIINCSYYVIGVGEMNGKYFKSVLVPGFSLIELMVVIAIVALLTAIAVPSYRNYLAQSKVAEIFSLASDQMTQYQNLVNLGNVTSVTTSDLGTYIDTAIQNNTASAVGNAAANTVYILLNTAAANIDPSLSGLEITFTPTALGSTTGDTTNTNIKWVCTFSNASSSDPATALKLLSSGNCTGV